MMETLYLGINKLNTLETALNKGLTEQFLEANLN